MAKASKIYFREVFERDIAFEEYVYCLYIKWHLGTAPGHRGQSLVMHGVVVLMVSID